MPQKNFYKVRIKLTQRGTNNHEDASSMTCLWKLTGLRAYNFTNLPNLKLMSKDSITKYSRDIEEY